VELEQDVLLALEVVVERRLSPKYLDEADQLADRARAALPVRPLRRPIIVRFCRPVRTSSTVAS